MFATLSTRSLRRASAQPQDRASRAAVERLEDRTFLSAAAADVVTISKPLPKLSASSNADEQLVYGPDGAVPGDANGDGIVNLIDFNILASNFGAGPGATLGMGDFDGDGFVELDDFGILAGAFGTMDAPNGDTLSPVSSAAHSLESPFRQTQFVRPRFESGKSPIVQLT